MGFFRVRRSVRIACGIRLNLGKRSASVSFGVRGAHLTVGKNGTHATVGLPGTGLSYTEVSKTPHRPSAPTQPTEALDPAPTPEGSALRGVLWIALAIILAVAIWKAVKS